MSHLGNRIANVESERRLAEVKEMGARSGVISIPGARPVGAPFPQASPTTGYYGVPLLKEPQWTNEVPLYFFIGGAAGAAAVIASAARWISRDVELARSARWVAAAGAVISPALLASDLGVPSRFLNMLRVFKVQSPMSVGAWTLAAFSSSAMAAAFAGRLRINLPAATPVVMLENAAGILSAATGLMMASYTGVLIGATVIPVWHNHVGTLPLHFAASGMNSAASILELVGHDDSKALNLLGLAASAYEMAQGIIVETKRTRANAPLQKGRSGFIVRLGGVLSGPLPFALRLVSLLNGNKKLRRVAACSSIAGSVLTRFGWVSAGKASARDYQLPLQRSSAPLVTSEVQTKKE